MAGLGSNRDLWHFITGSYLRRPPDLVTEELKKNQDKLVKGINFYEKPKKDGISKLQKERKIKDVQLDFVQKLSKFLQLDESQSHDIFRLYLLHDYRGSQKELQRLLSVDRHAQALILKVCDYYYSERLCLLRCVKHLFSYWQEEKHPYKDQYAAFVEDVSDNETFISQIVLQYTELCDEQAPTWEVHGNYMNERQAAIWVTQNLREQCELLEIMVLFYKEYMHPPTPYASLAAIFKKQGFGKRQTNKHLLDESADPLLNRIGYLQVILLLEGVDLEFLLKCHENNCLTEHHIVKSPTFKTIDGILSSLGDIPQHGPVLIMWAVFRQMALGAEGSSAITRKLGNQALALRVFDFLDALLRSEPFNGKTMLASVCQYVIYSTLCTVLSIFHEDTLGDTQGLYAVAAKLVKQPNISEDFWQKGLSDGLGVLLYSAQQRFPLEFLPLLQLSTSLASSSKESARKMVAVLQQQPVYMEYFDRNRSRDLQSTENDDVWQLVNAKRPYNSDMLIIPHGCYGLLTAQPGKGGQVIQWDFSYDAISVFTAETSALLLQVAQGATTITQEGIEKVTEVAHCVHALVTSDPSLAELFGNIIDMMCPIIQRFSLLSPPSLPLLAAAIDTVTCVAKQHPKTVWHGLQQTGLLPYLTENLDNLAEYTSGAGLSAGTYGSILAGYECTQGQYPVTIALLKLTEALVQPLHAAESLESLTAILLFICREIFPVFGKWRYYEPTGREQVGQLCLRIFHKILNILNNDKAKKSAKVSLRDLCVYSLLFTESGRAVLDIISTGVDTVEMALSLQGSVQEGAGVELIQLIKLAFSVLNRLLLLRPSDSPPSPVEHALSTQPANRAHRHVVATIAQYVYHRHDMRLPTLATLLLKRLAMVFPMSILACLGNEAEAIRDMYLTRLAARTEDVRLKVVILELLGVCVETQPGLTEMYLNVQPAPLSSSSTSTATSSSNDPSTSTGTASTTTGAALKDANKKSKESKKDLSVGRSSCLITLLDLIEEKKQGLYQCPSDLLCAALQFLHALWYGRRETAMTVLRDKPTYWRSVCLSLMRDLPEPTASMKEASFNTLEKEVKTCAHILRILAQELYAVDSDKLDSNLKNVVKDIVSKERLQYWSMYLREKLRVSGVAGYEPGEDIHDDGTLQLLLSWRSLILVLAVHKPACFTLGDNVKNQILKDILDGLQAQFSNGLNELNIKLASISSALYFTVLKHWRGTVREWAPVLEQLLVVLTQTCANSETLVPSIQIGILGALNIALQHLRVSILKDVDAAVLKPLVPVVCGVLQQSTYQLYPRAKGEGAENEAAAVDVKLKLQVITVVLLEELIVAMDRTEEWLPAVTEHSILQGLLGSVQTWIEARQGKQYVSAVLALFITMSNISQAAELLALNGLTHHLCLAIGNIHTDVGLAGTPKKQKLGTDGSKDWSDVYLTYLKLNTCMLNTLSYTFLQDALSFVGVHQDRMFKTLENIRLDLSPAALGEVEETCHFLSRLAIYRREWRLHLPEVLNRLMTYLCYLCHTCVSLLIRPLALQHMLEKKSGTDRSKQLGPEKLTMTPLTKRLSSQTSIDDSDTSNQQVLQTQHSLLRILAECFATMRQFSPDLCGILLDQSLDVAEYEPLLQVAFSTPSMDVDSAPSFGTMISATSMCLRLLTKLDPKSTSPSKSPKGENPMKRSVIQYVMENALWLIMSQAGRYLREPNLAPRDKQLLKRELSAELNSFLISIQRHFRRAPTSPANSTLLSPGGNKPLVFASSQEQAYFEMVDSFVKNVLR